MAKQLLIYETAVPVSSARHRDLSIERSDYEFVSDVNSIPLTAIEMPRAAREYTIVFGGDEGVTPLVIVGVEGNQNLYVADDGTWSADYVPAFVRRYPFVFSLNEEKKQFMLCIDESWSGCNREGRGQRLFDDEGERTDYLNQMLNFLEQYQAHFDRTQAYAKKLKELNLLESMKADFTLPDGTKKSLVGFQVVNRDKLKALPADKLSELAQSDELELTYNHLLSMNNFEQMLSRVNSNRPTESDHTTDQTTENQSGG